MKKFDRDWTEEILKEIFDIYGEIESVKVSKNKDTGESNGYGYIVFRSQKAAARMIADSQTGNIPCIAEFFDPK